MPVKSTDQNSSSTVHEIEIIQQFLTTLEKKLNGPRECLFKGWRSKVLVEK